MGSSVGLLEEKETMVKMVKDWEFWDVVLFMICVMASIVYGYGLGAAHRTQALVPVAFTSGAAGECANCGEALSVDTSKPTLLFHIKGECKE